MRYQFIAWMCTACVVAAAGDATAQSTAWGTYGYVSFNGVYQTSSSTFTNGSPITANRETGDVTTTHRIEPGPVYDVTAGGRLKGNLGLGYGVSYFRRSETGEIAADVPHPFYFDQFRAVTGQSSLQREDLALHLSVMWLLPVSDAFQVAVFGGPSYFKTRQELVNAVQVTDAYPFDSAQFVGATSTREEGSHVGYNAGIDLSVFFSSHAGVGGLIRYSRAKLDLPSPGGSTVSVTAGGLQTGIGFRVRF